MPRPINNFEPIKDQHSNFGEVVDKLFTWKLVDLTEDQRHKAREIVSQRVEEVEV